MSYKGDIIEESLTDKGVLKTLNILSTRVEKVTKAHKTPHLSQWTLHTIEVPEDQADSLAKQLSKVVESGGPGHNWYIDYRDTGHHYVIFKDKVFKIDRSRKQDYEQMIQYGLSIGIPDYQLPNFADLPIDVLESFLKAAHAHTYANVNAKQAESLRPGSKDYHYEAGGLAYHDTYFGSTRAIGEEVVYRNGEPAWGMNYYGFILDGENGESLYDTVLRPALMAGSTGKVPVRGPEEFVIGDYKYTFHATGTLGEFTGVEEISKNGQVVCKHYCHGGFIEP